MMGQSGINLTPYFYIYVKTWYLISMSREIRSLIYSHDRLANNARFWHLRLGFLAPSWLDSLSFILCFTSLESNTFKWI